MSEKSVCGESKQRLTTGQLVANVARRTGLPVTTASRVYKGLLEELIEITQRGDDAVLTGFGRFYRQDHKGHKVYFGKTDIEGYSVLKFSAARSMNRKFNDRVGEAQV